MDPISSAAAADAADAARVPNSISSDAPKKRSRRRNKDKQPGPENNTPSSPIDCHKDEQVVYEFEDYVAQLPSTSTAPPKSHPRIYPSRPVDQWRGHHHASRRGDYSPRGAASHSIGVGGSRTARTDSAHQQPLTFDHGRRAHRKEINDIYQPGIRPASQIGQIKIAKRPNAGNSSPTPIAPPSLPTPQTQSLTNPVQSFVLPSKPDPLQPKNPQTTILQNANSNEAGKSKPQQVLFDHTNVDQQSNSRHGKRKEVCLQNPSYVNATMHPHSQQRATFPPSLRRDGLPNGNGNNHWNQYHHGFDNSKPHFPLPSTPSRPDRGLQGPLPLSNGQSNVWNYRSSYDMTIPVNAARPSSEQQADTSSPHPGRAGSSRGSRRKMLYDPATGTMVPPPQQDSIDVEDDEDAVAGGDQTNEVGPSQRIRQLRHRNSSSRNGVSIDNPGQAPFKPSLFDEYITPQQVQQGLRQGELHKGPIRINKRNRFHSYVSVEGRERDIFILGQRHRNRAFDGDVVVVKMLDGQELADAKSKFQLSRDERRLEGDERQKKVIMAMDETLDGMESSDGEDESTLLGADDEDEDFENPFGKVVSIAERSPNQTFCGILTMDRWGRKESEVPTKSYAGIHPDFKFIWFKPTDKRVPLMTVSRSDVPIEFLQDPDAFTKVLFRVSVSKWTTTMQYPFGSLHGAVGQIGAIGPETDALLIENGIGWFTFSDDVLACLPAMPWNIPESEIAKRRDFRGERVFTVDPQAARDLDDAISCKPLGNGTYEVGVHIADVSYFVKAATSLDREARHRSTTIYLVQKTIPMLPSLLCEELCSLNPNVDRLAFSVVWIMNEDAEIIGEPWFGRSIIRSCAKLSYDHAQSIIEGNSNWNDLPSVEIGGGYNFDDLKLDILTMFQLSIKMRTRRFENGALSINSIKLSFTLDPEGNPVNCRAYDIRDSNRLIEEFMLLANMAVATKLRQAFPEDALLRRHEHPSPSALAEFLGMVSKLGIEIDPTSSSTLQASFDAIASRDVRYVLRLLAIKPMKRARYFRTGSSQITPSWHYALNVPLYTHFTSPIRRYCDLVVHRLLDCALRGSRNPYAAKVVDGFASHCNIMKDLSKNAQEASQRLYLVAYLDHLAKTQSGQVLEKGIVFRVGNRYYDVLVEKYGIERRIWVEDCMASEGALGCDFDEDKNELYIFWSKKTVAEGSSIIGERSSILDDGTSNSGEVGMPMLAALTPVSSKEEVEKIVVIGTTNHQEDEVNSDGADSDADWTTDDDVTTDSEEEDRGMVASKRRGVVTDDESSDADVKVEHLVQQTAEMSLNGNGNDVIPKTPSKSPVVTPKARKSPFTKRMIRRNINTNLIHVQVIKVFDCVDVRLCPSVERTPPEIKMYGANPTIVEAELAILVASATNGGGSRVDMSNGYVESCPALAEDCE
ncbi:hypothetical protein SeLEV6574_g06777 [Synchytrium endobioticum]|uniref:DIS3-like exonuclease 2 n=1 Tax=Synchytrium endobioticum TaxID=286115 RepID=A0A507CF27_9FUNG|nr:hypothetical protein SeLEV6574_g06777 [Synchytrium endobioticum]